MLETALGVLLGILGVLLVLFVLSVLTVLVYVRIIREQTKVNIPEGVQEFKLDNGLSWYIHCVSLKIDEEQAKKHAPDLVHDNISLIAGYDGQVYPASIRPQDVGKVDQGGYIYVMSPNGVRLVSQGEDVDQPRLHMKIHRSALS